MLRGSSKYQERVLAITGTVVLLCIALVAFFVVANPFGGGADDQFSIAINTPYVGQGRLSFSTGSRSDKSPTSPILRAVASGWPRTWKSGLCRASRTP
jgi:hypothetical protein